MGLLSNVLTLNVPPFNEIMMPLLALAWTPPEFTWMFAPASPVTAPRFKLPPPVLVTVLLAPVKVPFTASVRLLVTFQICGAARLMALPNVTFWFALLMSMPALPSVSVLLAATVTAPFKLFVKIKPPTLMSAPSVSTAAFAEEMTLLNNPIAPAVGVTPLQSAAVFIMVVSDLIISDEADVVALAMFE